MKLLRFSKIPLALRLVLATFLLNMAAETTQVFIPLYADSLGASKVEIGFILAANAIAFFIASLIIGRQSDIHGRLVFIRIGFGLIIVAYILHVFIHSAMTLLIVRSLQGLCMGTIMAAITAYTYEYQRQIGRYVAFGSLGVLFGDITAAIIRDYHTLFITSAIISLLAFFFALTLSEDKRNRVPTTTLPLPLLKANGRVYLSFFLRQTGASAAFAVFPLLLASIGASRTWIAVINAINMGSQFIAMRFVEKINPVKSFRIGLLLSALVFVLYGVVTRYPLFIPVQILLGIAWSLLYVGVLVYLLRRNPERGSVSGLLFSTHYVAWSIGSFMGGGIAQIWGYSAVMFTGSAMALLATITSRGMKSEEKPTPAT